MHAIHNRPTRRVLSAALRLAALYSSGVVLLLVALILTVG
jgi:hypothetical protein